MCCVKVLGFGFFLLFGRAQIPFSEGDKIASCHTRKKYEITELGIMHPEEVPTAQLLPGQVGYVACNMKQSSEGKILNNARLLFLTWVLQPTLVIPCIMLGIPSSPCPGFNPPRRWYGQAFNRLRPYSNNVYTDRSLLEYIP